MSLMAGLALASHNFPEGLATFAASQGDSKVGASLGVAIAIHNIPAVSIILTISTVIAYSRVGCETTRLGVLVVGPRRRDAYFLHHRKRLQGVLLVRVQTSCIFDVSYVQRRFCRGTLFGVAEPVGTLLGYVIFVNVSRPLSVPAATV